MNTPVIDPTKGLAIGTGSDTPIIAAYTFDANANDVSGNAYNATPVNSPDFTAKDRFGQSSKAVELTAASNQYCEIAVATHEFVVAEVKTVTGWFKTSVNIIQTIASFGNTERIGFSRTRYPWAIISLTNIGILRYGYLSGGTAYNIAVTTDTFNDGIWHFFSATFGEYIRNNITGFSLNIDGAIVQLNQEPAVLSIKNDIRGKTTIGRYSGAAIVLPFDGKLDNIRIYNRALSQYENDNLFRETYN